MNLYHLNCVQIESPLGPAIGHCLLLEESGHLTLIDAGLSLAETREPITYLGQELVDQVGFRFDEAQTAIRQIEQLGFAADQVRHIVCSHLDPDHMGGIADFPRAIIHVSAEEYLHFKQGDPRYLPRQLAHQPQILQYPVSETEWFGMEARKLEMEAEMYLIPLFGHTLGHCGVAFPYADKWIFYVGDAYYYRVELSDPAHPVHQMAIAAAVDNEMRLVSLGAIKRVVQQYPGILYFSYHDPTEFVQ